MLGTYGGFSVSAPCVDPTEQANNCQRFVSEQGFGLDRENNDIIRKLVDSSNLCTTKSMCRPIFTVR